MYLYKEETMSYEALNLAVDAAVQEHNCKRRYRHLNGQTPFEVYNKVPNKSKLLLEQQKQAQKQRRNDRRSLACCLDEMFTVVSGVKPITKV
jgi:hypothetical protein